MTQRGRKSAAELATVPNVVEVVPRPVAPDILTDEQAEEWDCVVSRMPADWFPRETHGLLIQYCRHVVTARRVAELIENEQGAEVLDIENYDRLLKMQEREGRALSSLATRMRISQQAKFDKTKKTPKTVRKPWES